MRRIYMKDDMRRWRRDTGDVCVCVSMWVCVSLFSWVCVCVCVFVSVSGWVCVKNEIKTLRQVEDEAEWSGFIHSEEMLLDSFFFSRCSFCTLTFSRRRSFPNPGSAAIKTFLQKDSKVNAGVGETTPPEGLRLFQESPQCLDSSVRKKHLQIQRELLYI